MMNTELPGVFDGTRALHALHLVYMTMPESPDLFDEAETISSYTREQALSDGVLFDVSTTAKEAGFKYPVALTEAVHSRLLPTELDKQLGQSFEGRLWDVLWVLRSRAGKTDTVFFDVIVADAAEAGAEEPQEQNLVHLKAIIAPGDAGEPVITIMFEHED